jgi:hypothetical protein
VDEDIIWQAVREDLSPLVGSLETIIMALSASN